VNLTIDQNFLNLIIQFDGTLSDPLDLFLNLIIRLILPSTTSPAPTAPISLPDPSKRGLIRLPNPGPPAFTLCVSIANKAFLPILSAGLSGITRYAMNQGLIRYATEWLTHWHAIIARCCKFLLDLAGSAAGPTCVGYAAMHAHALSHHRFLHRQAIRPASHVHGFPP
jgi:hypothetical protein